LGAGDLIDKDSPTQEITQVQRRNWLSHWLFLRYGNVHL